MRSKDFIQGLSEVIEAPISSLLTVDRSLAKAGYRHVAKGRAVPEVTLIEGLRLLVAFLGSDNLTNASAEIERLERHRAVPLLANSPEFENLFGNSPDKIAEMTFLKVLCLVAVNISEAAYPADQLWVTLEKRGFVNIGFWKDKDWQELGFSALQDNVIETHTKSNVITKFAINGRVLAWIAEATRVQD